MKVRKGLCVALMSVTLLSGCSNFKTTVKQNMSPVLYSQLVETYDGKVKPVKTVYDGLENLDVPKPYTPYGDIEVQDSVTTFDILDNSNNIVNVQFDGSKFKAKNAVDWTTYREIAGIVQKLMGKDCVFTVESTYEKGIVVHAQGVTYTWKNKKLELEK